jgi:hypothetical protein
MTDKRVDLNFNTPIIGAKAPVIKATAVNLQKPVIAAAVQLPTIAAVSTNLSIHLNIELAKLKLGLYEKLYTSTILVDRVEKFTSTFKPESLIVSDICLHTVNKVLLEISVFQESIKFDIGRVNSETVFSLETFSVVFEMPRSEVIGATDLITLAYNKLVLDTLSPTDDWAGLATIDDDQYIDFGKSAIEYAIIQENFIKSFDKGVNETLLCVETRTAWMQSYWAFDYNETDYVGLSAII